MWNQSLNSLKKYHKIGNKREVMQYEDPDPGIRRIESEVSDTGL